MIAYCSCAAGRASPYEEEEIVFLLSVAGLIRKEPLILHLFLPAHEHSWAVASLNPSLGMKAPVKNTLFDNAKLDSNVRRVSLLQEANSSDAPKYEMHSNPDVSKSTQVYTSASCDCTENDSFILFDTILRYFDSADSIVVVRACEAALIIISLPTIGVKCEAQKYSFENFCRKLSQKLAFLCQEIPEDMDTGDIEDCVSSWGYVIFGVFKIYSLNRYEIVKVVKNVAKKMIIVCFKVIDSILNLDSFVESSWFCVESFRILFSNSFRLSFGTANRALFFFLKYRGTIFIFHFNQVMSIY